MSVCGATQFHINQFHPAVSSDKFVIRINYSDNTMQAGDEIIHWLTAIESITEHGERISPVSCGTQLDGFEAAFVDCTTPQSVFGIQVKDGVTISGLFKPGYVPPGLLVGE